MPSSRDLPDPGIKPASLAPPTLQVNSLLLHHLGSPRIHWKKVKVKVAQSCLTLCDPQVLYSPRNSPGQSTGVGSLSFLQGIFPTQGSNPGLPHCRQILYQLSHKGAQEYWGGSLSLLQRSFLTQESNCNASGFFINWATMDECKSIVRHSWIEI